MKPVQSDTVDRIAIEASVIMQKGKGDLLKYILYHRDEYENFSEHEDEFRNHMMRCVQVMIENHDDSSHEVKGDCRLSAEIYVAWDGCRKHLYRANYGYFKDATFEDALKLLIAMAMNEPIFDVVHDDNKFKIKAESMIHGFEFTEVE